MRTLLVLLACTALAGCSAPSAELSPASGPSSGYYTVQIGAPGVSAASITQVQLGGVTALQSAAAAESLSVLVQGAPEPGPADLVVTGDAQKSFSGAFDYLPPLDPRFARLVAVGASYSQGVQDGVPSYHGALMSPPAQVARQLGGYFPLPLFVPGLFGEIGPKDIGPPPACDAPDIVAFVAKQGGQLVGVLANGFDTGRVNPDTATHNLAVGGSHIHDVIAGPASGDVGGNLISHLVYQPYDRAEVKPQLDVAESLSPTIVMLADVYGNDIIDAIFKIDEGIDPSLVTPEASFSADLAALLDRLDKTGAEVFISNMPRPSLLGAMAQRRAGVVAKQTAQKEMMGEDPQKAAAEANADADALVAAVDAKAVAFNGILAQAAKERPRVHVVDTISAVDAIAKNGLAVGGQMLTIHRFGGLLSLDGLHLTNTGYAMLANLFIGAINSALGTDVPPIDLGAVLAADPLSPSALAAAGLDASRCAK